MLLWNQFSPAESRVFGCQNAKNWLEIRNRPINCLGGKGWDPSWLWGKSCMLSCLCNERPGNSHSPTAPVVEVVSNGKDATHGAAQFEPPPLLSYSRECLCHCEMDRRCWLRRSPPHWFTLLFPFPLPITLYLQPSNHQKPLLLCYPHLNRFLYSYCIWPEWKLNIKCFPLAFLCICMK